MYNVDKLFKRIYYIEVGHRESPTHTYTKGKLMFSELTTKKLEFLTFVITGDICGENPDEPFYKTASLYYWARFAGLWTIPPEPNNKERDYFYPKTWVEKYHNTDWRDDKIYSG